MKSGDYGLRSSQLRLSDFSPTLCLLPSVYRLLPPSTATLLPLAMIYLDYNATTPLARRKSSAMEPYLRQAFGNASVCIGPVDRLARQSTMRGNKWRGCWVVNRPKSCSPPVGTEANNYALKGVFFARLEKQLPTHIITSQIEQSAILEPCRFLESLGAEVTRLPVDRFGLVDPTAVSEALRPHTALISIMHANNEVGTIQPLAEIAAIAHEHGGAHAHRRRAKRRESFDARGRVGRRSAHHCGHKLYAPKGVGALYVRSGVTLAPFMHGAGHEQGRRAGTENILEIVGLGAACEVAPAWINRPALHELRDYFWNSLLSAFGERVSLNGHPERRLPNTLNVNFHGQIGSELLATLPQLAPRPVPHVTPAVTTSARSLPRWAFRLRSVSVPFASASVENQRSLRLIRPCKCCESALAKRGWSSTDRQTGVSFQHCTLHGRGEPAEIARGRFGRALADCRFSYLTAGQNATPANGCMKVDRGYDVTKTSGPHQSSGLVARRLAHVAALAKLV